MSYILCIYVQLISVTTPKLLDDLLKSDVFEGVR
jgi:hypothetical protein